MRGPERGTIFFDLICADLKNLFASKIAKNPLNINHLAMVNCTVTGENK